MTNHQLRRLLLAILAPATVEVDARRSRLERAMSDETKAVVREAAEGAGLLFLRVGSVEPVHVTVARDWQAYNAMIGCEYADTASTTIAGLHLWVDDVGAVSGEKMVNAMASVLAGQAIYGDALVMALDHEGMTRPITVAETVSVMEIIAKAVDNARNALHDTR
jgi:hypothetical protein